MQKLNQVIAIEKGVKGRTYAAITELHKNAQKPDLYYGFNKSYTPKEDGNEQLPSESKKVVLRAEDVLRDVSDLFVDIMDVTATKDFANMTAKADITVKGNVLAKDVPVPYILFLEKQLTDLRTFIDKLPTLDESENWTKEASSGLFKTDKITTNRTAKIVKPIVKYEATKEHPAQTDLISVDETVGYWNTVKQSGAITRGDKRQLLERTEALLEAVKSARETANSVEAPEKHVGADLLAYIFVSV